MSMSAGVDGGATRGIGHTGKLEVHGVEATGRVAVFYAHGSESMRTFLGKSKLHSRPDCAALLGARPGKTVILDWMTPPDERQRCRRCSAPETLRPATAP